MAVVGFLVNPIAGMGGRVGLKGTDEMEAEARRRGAEPVARRRALEMLQALKVGLDREPAPPAFAWLSCTGEMGADVLTEAGFSARVIAVPESGHPPSAGQTRAAAAEFMAARVDIILFCGGDGTARDVAGVVGQHVPILGIPSGVKMYSGVFGASPSRTAEILLRFLKGELRLSEAEVLDLDEERYRAGEWKVRLHHIALTPFEPTYTQPSKQLISETSDEESKALIASHVAEIISGDHETLYILGPGSTLGAVAAALGLPKTVLGIDAVIDGKLIAEDLAEEDILSLVSRGTRCRLVLSPIGAQGFVIGRGNLQLSPEVLRRIGVANIMVLATPMKLARTPVLRFDTGDPELDSQIAARGSLPVVIGYRHEKMVRIVV